MIIYKATNKINKKIYIGQSTKSLEERIKAHKKDYKRLDTYFYRAIKKYGWDNFQWEIIHDNIESEDELDELEIYYIKLYNCFDNPNVGYNTQSGGKHFRLTEEECKNRSIRAKGENNPMYGKPGTWLGKNFSEEHKKHISEALTGLKRPDKIRGKNPSAKKIINLTTGEIFDCILDGAEKYNISRNAIVNNIKGKTKSCVGCQWDFYDENKNYNTINPNNRRIKSKIYVKELNAIFENATETAKAINCSNSTISKACKKALENNQEYALVKKYHIKFIQ